MDGAKYVGEECDYAFQEEVEEEDASGTTEEAVEDHDGFACCCLWSCVAITWNRKDFLNV